VIALDTNLLVYAHRKDSPWFQPAYACVERLAEGRDAWAIPWPCIHEFLGIVTHARVYAPPSPIAIALDQVNAWMQSPSLVLIAETEHYWPRLQALLRSARASGPRVHDARIAALCLDHGITELWSADRDFSGFPGLRVRNPLFA
jgi:uncharacterized protein